MVDVKFLRGVLMGLGFVFIAFVMWLSRATAQETPMPARCNEDICIVPRAELESFVIGARNTQQKLQEMTMRCWHRKA